MMWHKFWFAQMVTSPSDISVSFGIDICCNFALLWINNDVAEQILFQLAEFIQFENIKNISSTTYN